MKNKYTPYPTLPSLSLAMAFAVLGGTQANAANITWGNTGTNFATGANWLGSTAPANNITADIGVFTNGTVIDSGTGRIGIYGYATGSTNLNAQAISNYNGVTLRSANTQPRPSPWWATPQVRPAP